MGEPLPATGAPVRLAPHVGPLVDEELQGGAEAASTLTALVGPLAQVDTLMLEELGSLAEVFRAVGAFVGSLSRVDSLVPLKVRAPSKALATVLALVVLRHGMTSLMGQKR